MKELTSVRFFSLVSGNDSFLIIMVLVAHFNMELYQMDMEMAFLNGQLFEEVYMSQSEGFEVDGQEHRVYKLKSHFYGHK